MAKDKKATYYDAGGIETLDILKAKLTYKGYKDWLLGNMIKYACRANFKGECTRDIEKIKFYSTEWLEIVEEGGKSGR
ncbi:MAG: DUF3310 domain-containing protein [Bacteroidetes bacterium]|nr:MAG: DUF3310 domain-containing protein [Bacteroidota bacterium]